MAQKESAAVIIGLLIICLFAGGAFAVPTPADIKKFPPVSGEIYGEGTRGINSISINGKPVALDPDLNFKAAVNLKAGEKYLVLRISYPTLTIIKKYLILRRSAVKKFKVFVAKENIEKMAQQALTAKKPTPSGKKAALATKAREEKKKLLALKAQQEESWTEKVASPKFYPNEFRDNRSVEALSRSVERDMYGIPFNPKATNLERLNEIIRLPDLYERAVKKGKPIKLTPQIKRLIAETQEYRKKPFSKLSPFEQKKVMLLNRLLLESIYPAAPRREQWLAAEKKEKLPAKLSPEQEQWVKSVSSPNFYPNEFEGKRTADVLSRAIERDKYGIPLPAQAGSIDRLNQLIRVPDLYETIVKKGKQTKLTSKLEGLITETKDYRMKAFSDLSAFEQKKIMLLNRLLIEAIYPDAPQRRYWTMAPAGKAVPITIEIGGKTKTFEYLYVWEFSEGKLLLVKESSGKYSAEIYVPVSEDWLNLKGISAKELSQLIRKPIKTFKKKKK
jgi:hypothetical protein